ncbi:hypothetical protein BDK51DRAFT_26506 [Blyttiomyces helicus]|uniref:Uncharacterized protein n=1 Tax=Blyttiomyces helicus TaxID=388810 RepID=A0A4P9WBC4_9FUNG|nr:hypothetical protein BDK51DRAFT_26506 [Blyttiomyces helicus]|eukprot:RKO88210.1 hypothetical protein BDK51DRAFT_26506 [Blyttiomyces helicus]
MAGVPTVGPNNDAAHTTTSALILPTTAPALDLTDIPTPCEIACIEPVAGNIFDRNMSPFCYKTTKLAETTSRKGYDCIYAAISAIEGPQTSGPAGDDHPPMNIKIEDILCWEDSPEDTSLKWTQVPTCMIKKGCAAADASEMYDLISNLTLCQTPYSKPALPYKENWRFSACMENFFDENVHELWDMVCTNPAWSSTRNCLAQSQCPAADVAMVCI